MSTVHVPIDFSGQSTVTVCHVEICMMGSHPDKYPTVSSLPLEVVDSAEHHDSPASVEMCVIAIAWLCDWACQSDHY